MIKVIFISLVSFIVIIRILYSLKKRKKVYEIPDHIKNTYKKLSVDVNEISIRSRGYYEEAPDKVTTNGYSTIDVIESIEGKASKKLFKEISVLCYSLDKERKEIVLSSQPIEMPKIVLEAKLELVRKIDIYYNPLDNRHVYYDLYFLY